MNFVTLNIVALSLTFDTFAVSVMTGLIARDIRFREATRIALVMGFFQALMPLAGWFIGIQLKPLISDYDHWIAFGLLTAIGIKPIVESFKKEEDRKDFDPFRFSVLIGIAIATSIDALIVGMSFAFIAVNIYFAIGLIGFVTYVAAMLGMLFGKKAGKRFGPKMEILGGLILIVLGIKILCEHLSC